MSAKTKKLTKGRVLFSRNGDRGTSIIRTAPFGSWDHPVAVIPCATVKQARTIVKLHANNLPAIVRANLKAKRYTDVGCDLVLRHMADALNMPELSP